MHLEWDRMEREGHEVGNFRTLRDALILDAVT
jgi:hypothetical protein